MLVETMLGYLGLGLLLGLAGVGSAYGTKKVHSKRTKRNRAST